MKTRMLRRLARVALSLVGVAAWGTGATAQSLSGVYGGERCPYRLTFRPKDVVYIQFLGGYGGKVIGEIPGQYKVDGDKVPVTATAWSTVFTRKGDALETAERGEVCTKLSDVASARPQVARAPVFDSGFITVNVSEGPSAVYIDNRQMDTVPVIHYKVTAGTHRIQVLIRGRTVNETVRVESGATLVKSYGAVAAGAVGFISVDVTGAPERPRSAAHPVVVIDNLIVGRTPLINYQVRAGQHRIMLEVGRGPNRFVNDTVQVDSGATVVKSYEAAPR